jgi:hypothetical protein
MYVCFYEDENCQHFKNGKGCAVYNNPCSVSPLGYFQIENITEKDVIVELYYDYKDCKGWYFSIYKNTVPLESCSRAYESVFFGLFKLYVLVFKNKESFLKYHENIDNFVLDEYTGVSVDTQVKDHMNACVYEDENCQTLAVDKSDEYTGVSVDTQVKDHMYACVYKDKNCQILAVDKSCAVYNQSRSDFPLGTFEVTKDEDRKVEVNIHTKLLSVHFEAQLNECTRISYFFFHYYGIVFENRTIFLSHNEHLKGFALDEYTRIPGTSEGDISKPDVSKSSQHAADPLPPSRIDSKTFISILEGYVTDRSKHEVFYSFYLFVIVILLDML